MELQEFLRQMHAEVETEISERLKDEATAYPHQESVFAEVVMQHMSEIGMTYEPEVCHFAAKVARANLRLSGYALSEDSEELDLFVSLYDGNPELTTIPDSDTLKAAEQCVRFLNACATGALQGEIDESNDAHALAGIIKDIYPALGQIRIYVLTDRQAKSKNFQPRDVAGKTVKLEVMDIQRLHRHLSEGKPRDELVVNFEDVSGSALPCVYVPGETIGYDYALTAVPAETLRFIYEKYGARLLEANVRSLLSATGKVNKGIRETLQTDPERFMAFNNGIVVVADEAGLGRAPDGSVGITWLRGMQIVNGGQTTASIYFTKKKSPLTDLSRVRVPAKVIVLKIEDPAAEEALISDISRYANSQNAVKLSDLSANKPFHIELERLANNTYLPDGMGRWFYERAAGSYTTLLVREGSTPAQLAKLKAAIPTSRKITKTDLAKYLTAWDQHPELVSLGSQKNFDRFKAELDADETRPLPTTSDFKAMIAKAIIFKKTHSMVRPMFPAFQGNVAAYLVSLLANRLGDRLALDRIWANQDLSPALRLQLQTWAHEVNEVLHRSADGKMVSEWAKKPACWNVVVSATYSAVMEPIPELRPA